MNGKIRNMKSRKTANAYILKMIRIRLEKNCINMYEYIIILRLNTCKLYTIKPLQMQWLYIYLKNMI